VIATRDSISILPSGKFFDRAGVKFFLKAIRFGDSSSTGTFEDKIAVGTLLRGFRAAHTTAVVVDEYEAESILDLVAQADLFAIVELELQPEELFSRRAVRHAIVRLRKRVADLRYYPGVIGYLLHCALDADELRSRGIEIARTRLSRMVSAVRSVDANGMVGVKHQAGTLGLTLTDEDFLYALIPPLAPDELRSSVIRLHNLAQARPVVLEFGDATPNYDDLVACAFGLGAAGVVMQRGPIDNPRSTRPADGSLSLKILRVSEFLPFLALNGSCPPQPVLTPKVSVVICAYNAERTMRACMESVRRLDYPNFEVIIVDDGSRDATPQIAADYPEFRLIRQPNKGLSVARNVGLHAALGEIIAYTDSDCVVDPHWLTFMVSAMVEGELDGCGGPNYAPHEEGRIEGCVAASPGAPCHVLIGDDRAEHLAGCNMVFRKAALEDVGGFDPQFTAAGDDVDICWRLIDEGYVLGYCPSAFVWHFRRNTVKAYYGQQRGYGKAEAMLFFKYPERFNVLGQVKWRGTIPGIARTLPGGRRSRVGWVRGAQWFERVDEMTLTVFAVAPMTAEWTTFTAALVILSLLCGVTVWPGLALFAAGPLWAGCYASRAPLEKCHKGFISRVLIGWLAYSGPIVRTIARYRWRTNARKLSPFDNPLRQRPTADWKSRSLRLSYWNDAYTTREAVLEHLHRLFGSLNRPVVTDNGWNDFDLRVEVNPWTRIQVRTAEEELGGLELKTNVEARLRLSIGARAGLGASALGAAIASLLGSPLMAVAFGIVLAATMIGVVGGLAEAKNLAYHSIEQCAGELNLVPLGKPVIPAAIPSMPSAVEPERTVEASQPGIR
jgi:glycosyltransferase involved in cell wall biosynthesis